MVNLIGRILGFLGGEEGGLTSVELKRMLKEGFNPFSKFLPYDKYDSETGIFLNKDGSKGFIFMCLPLWGESERARTVFSTVIKELPEKGVLSVHFISNDHIKPVLDWYRRLKKARNNLVLQRIADGYAEYLERGSKEGLANLLGVPVRSFVILVSVKVPEGVFTNIEELRQYRIDVKEQLKGCGLNPVDVTADVLLKFLFNFFNGYWYEDLKWDDKKNISSQSLLSDRSVKVGWKRIVIGDRKFGCVTFASLPKGEYDSFTTSELLGPSGGAMFDGKQIHTHFMYSVIIYRDSALHRSITKKAGLFFTQMKGDAHKSIMGRLIGEYAMEHSEAASDIEKGEVYFYVFPVIWVWDRNDLKLKQAIRRVRNLLSEHGIANQEDRGILSILFLMSLPFGFNLSSKEIGVLDRHFVCNASEASALLPLVGDISGVGEPVMLFISRKGQLVSFNPFFKGSPNKNCMVMGATGYGKSVNMNLFTYSLYSAGALIRIIDLGYSYYKQCRIVGGNFIDFSTERPICLNPFSFLKDVSSEDLQGSLDCIANVIEMIVFEKTQERITKEHRALIRSAVNRVWKEHGPEADLDRIYEYFALFDQMAREELEMLCAEEESCMVDLKKEAQKLAFALSDWTTGGAFGKWLNGKASFDLVNSEYVVLEMERIKRTELLLKVVTALVINAATQSFYLMDREKMKVFLVEECGILLKDNPFLKGVLEECYRRMRKYNGSTITVFQGPLDLKNVGDVGHVMLANSAYLFFLTSPQYKMAKEEKLLDLSDWEVEQLSSLQLVKPRYGEIGLKTPWGFGVVRTVMNGTFYYFTTTDSEEWMEVEREVKKKMNGNKTKKGEDRILLEVLEDMGRRRDKKLEERFLLV